MRLILLWAGLSMASPILSVNFSGDTLGNYTQVQAQNDFGNLEFFTDSIGNGASIISDSGLSSGKALRAFYPTGCWGSHKCAAQWRVNLAVARDTMWIQYKVKFESTFQFNKGGKLPGLCGDSCNTGGVQSTGTSGWSTRMMWRRGGIAENYYYGYAPQNAATGYGYDYFWQPNSTDTTKFPLNTWVTVTHQVILNTPGKANGILRGWWNGQQVLEVDTLNYRTIDTVHINKFYFSTFFGGSDSTWASPVDTYVRFGDFVIDSLPLAGSGVAAILPVNSVGLLNHGIFDQQGITVRLAQNSSKIQVRLLDASGSLRSMVYQGPASAGNNHWNISGDLWDQRSHLKIVVKNLGQ